MKLVYEKLGLCIDVQENEVLVLVLENPRDMQQLMNEFWKQGRTDETTIILSKEYKELSFKKSVELMFNPFDLNINSSRVLNKVYHNMQILSDDELYLEYMETKTRIFKYFECLIQKMDYNISYDVEFTPIQLYKAFNVHIDIDDGSPFENIIAYIMLLRRILNIEVVVFSQLKSILTQKELQVLYEMARLEKLQLILLESYETEKMVDEKVVIIDNQKCIITY